MSQERWTGRRVPAVVRPPRRDLGEEPDPRFSMANERTFLSWIRTALALDAAELVGPAQRRVWSTRGCRASALAV